VKNEFALHVSGIDSPNFEGRVPVAVPPRPLEKPWGWELVWAEAEHYVGKLLFVRAGESLSLQYHEVKDESWLVREGRARLELGEHGADELDIVEISPGDALHYPPRTVHRVTAVEDTLILEVSTPHLDDVVRVEDRYGREGTSEP
jgi:mannose-6-phosphate isomerase